MKEYCHHCQEYVDYSIETECIEVLVNYADTVKILGERAYCNNCGKNVYIQELEHENLKKAKLHFDILNSKK